MRAATRATRLVLSLATVALLDGCGRPEPCLGLKRGDSVRVILIAPDPAEGSECGAALGIVSGAELIGTIRSIEGGGDNQDCVAAEADFTAPDGWTWTYLYPSTDDADISGWYDAKKGNCAGRISMGITAPGIPSPDWQPGEGSSPAYIDIGYSPRDGHGDPSCPGECGPRFGVKITR